MREGMRMQAAVLALAAAFFLVCGCAGTRVTVGVHPDRSDGGHERRTQHDGRGYGKRKGPPPWAPAHGYRAKHSYRYYPSAEVYFDLGRDVYFYYRHESWRVSATLPRRLRTGLQDYVILEMNTSRPYRYHSSVSRRYPPGRSGGNAHARSGHRPQGHAKGQGQSHAKGHAQGQGQGDGHGQGQEGHNGKKKAPWLNGDQ